MGDTINYIINITGNADSKITAIQHNAEAATDKIFGLRTGIEKFGMCLFALNNINQAFSGLKDSLMEMSQPGIELNKNMADLSAITGITGEKLNEIEGYARKSAKVFGGSAAAGVESYKLILSQLGPEIAKTPAALKAMGDSVNTLSKTMGGDTVSATEVLTTALNQFQVSLDNPIEAAGVMSEMMNVMAAAAREGSAELPQIKAALENAGMAAKMAGVSFAETNAAIQVLDKAGKKGAEGGVALRNVMATLSEGRFLPKDVQAEFMAAGIDVEALGDKSLTLSDRLNMLHPLLNDGALLTKLFGKENSNAAMALISGTTQMDAYTTAITGTNAANEQAQIVMGSFSEKMNRMKARFDDFKITLFDMFKGILPGVTASVTVLQGAVSLLTLTNAIACVGETALGKAINARAKAMRSSLKETWAMIYADGTWMGASFLAAGATHTLTVAVKSLGKAIYSIPIIGWIALGISLLAGLFKWLWDNSEKFRQVLFGVWESVKAVFTNIGVVISAIWENIVKPVFMAYYNVWKWAITGIWDFIVWLWQGITQAVQSVATFFTSIWGWITGTFKGIATWLDTNLLQPIKNVFGKMWDFVGDILNKIIDALAKPIGWIKDLWNKLFPDDKFKDIGKSYGEGVVKGTASWAASQQGIAGDGTQAGIDSPQLAGAMITGGAIPGNDAGGIAPGKSAEAIASGGTRNTEVNINFRNMVETISFSGTLKENKDDLRRQVEQIMAQVLGMVKATA